MFDRHPPFPIDGNFGVCAAMCGMLAQSSKGRLILLPALPSSWANGSVRGLRIAGNAEVYMTWREGRLSEVEIHADSDYEADVTYGEKTVHVTVKAGESLLLFA